MGFQASSKDSDEERETPVLLIVLFVVWTVFSLAAIAMSLVCTGKSGSTSQKFLGIITAFLFGPFYWVYWAVARREECYCNDACKRV